MSQNRRCPRCGIEMPVDAPGQLCPSCLLKTGMASQSELPGDALESTLPAGPSVEGSKAERSRLEPDQQFGGYRIVRRLGKGGMGTVYEAVHLASDRRVALKVLDHGMDAPDARKRFLREGRLAASISHPNSVYVFGTEEIDGSAVISMELVSGGTLQDQVRRQGPLSWKVAVDMMLQVIEGLEAAQAVGVLHRDVKPANCFVDGDGTVKVGDFGLSISTAPRDASNLTSEGTFLGTPAFSSPEQIRGDELDIRADIYSVGVTLFYLLTGQTPFEAENYVQLLARVLEMPAPSPQSIRSEIPKDLARVVSRCLEKQPANRYRGYDELKRALLPFGSTAPTPATLGLRFVASAIDGMLWMVLAFGAAMAWFGNLAAIPIPDMLDVYRSWTMLLGYAANLTALTLFYGIPEAIWGATLGKAICRLRVVGPERRRPGFRRALSRAAVFVFLPQLALLLWLPVVRLELGEVGLQLAAAGIGYTSNALLALMFVTVRRRNGFAAVHDLASGTRVIQKLKSTARPFLPVIDEPLPERSETPTVGPYFVLAELGGDDSSRLELGYDVTLLRKVWLRRLADDTPGLDSRGTAARPGRLRWLTGNRSPGSNWDAYEAPAGHPLPNLLTERQSWGSVRYWLLDLAGELNASLADGSLPHELALDRVWITADGRAKLLDFPAPGIDRSNPFAHLPPVSGSGFAAARTFLNQVAVATLESSPEAATAADQRPVSAPVPLHAKALLDDLPGLPTPPLPADELDALTRQNPSITHARRWMILAGCASLPIFSTLIMMFGFLIIESWVEQNPELLKLRYCLDHVQRLEQAGDRSNERRAALEVYIVGRFSEIISDPRRMADASVRGILTPGQRELAKRIVDEREAPSADELQHAEQVLSEFLEGVPKTYTESAAGSGSLSTFVRFSAFGMLVFCIAIPSVISSLLFRGGAVVHVLGVAFVHHDGSIASRLRVFSRSLIAWSPCLLAPVGFVLLAPALRYVFPDQVVYWGSWLLIIGVTVPALLSTALPKRSIPDYLAGTHMVPR